MAFQVLIGKAAPSVTLPNYTGEDFTISPGADGLPIALFFYPKSGSFGCTKEACQFRDAVAEKAEFGEGKVKVIGVSPDPVEKQKLFVEKQKLNYPVLCDEKGEARKTYHVGRGLLGLTDARVTFVIDGKGIVRDALDATMNYGAHAKFVARWLEKLAKEDESAAQVDRPAAQPVDATPAAAVDTPAV